jgi:reactive intermediate/imine deaminase
MTNKTVIQSENAPKAIGTYSQAIKVSGGETQTVYLSGQIPLDPATMTLVDDSVEHQIRQVFENLSAVAAAGGGSLNDVVKLNIFLTDLTHFALLNEIMAGYFTEPYPARAAIGVASLPRGAVVEMDGIMVLNSH